LLTMTSTTLILCLLALGLAGVNPQPLLAGERICEGSKLTKAACDALSCCEWGEGRCWWGGGVCPATATTAKATTKPATTVKPTTNAATTNSGSSSSGSCSAKVSWTKKSVLSGFDKYEVFGVPAFCEVGGNKTKCQHMLSVLAAYIDNNNDGCPDNPPDFLKNILKSTIPADEAGIGAVILTKKQSFQMPAGFQSYYGLTMWEAETRPECSGTQASDTCRDASLEEVFHLLTDKGYGPTWPAALGLYSTSNSSLTRAMDKARNPPSGTPLLAPVNGVWTYPSGAWWKHPDPTCQYNRCQTTEYHWHTTASYLGMYAGMTPDIYTYNTKEKMKTGDPLAVSIIENTSIGYRHPTVAPTGKYTGCSRCSATTGDTTSHGGAAQ